MNIEFEQIKSIKRVEPRIQHIQMMINALLKIVDFEYNGESVKVDGFKLKNLDNWTSQNLYGVDSLVAHLARQCDSDCQFCYHKGNPPDYALGKKSSFISEVEMDTRLSFFNEKENTALFASNYEQKEVLYDPNSLKYLKKIREKSKNMITINTNGLGLKAEMVKELKKLEPITVVFSVNSMSQKKRDAIMNNSKENDSIKILTLLHENQISFIASVAVWPTIEINDIENVIKTATYYEPYYIRLIMPGYTDHFVEKPVGDFSGHFDKCVEHIVHLRKMVDIPLVVYPEAYVCNKLGLYSDPYLIGVVKNSPLYYAGLKAGDIIKSINGYPIDMRTTAKTILSLILKFGEEFTIEFLRDGQLFSKEVNSQLYNYPYTQYLTNSPLGAVMSGGLQQSYVKAIQKLIRENNSKKVLFMTSDLMEKQAIDLFMRTNFSLKTSEYSITLCKPKNIYLGGNIAIGDMLTVRDFIFDIQQRQKRNPDIDLVIIPASAFYGSSGWKRDMSGHYYKEIEWRTGIKTCLLECECFIY